MEKEILHLWIGSFRNEEDFDDFIEEDESYYMEEEDDGHYVSKFAESQDTPWIDYDFLEAGFEDGNRSLYEKFTDYSFADQWLPAAQRRINELDLSVDINAVVFVGKKAVQHPVTIEDDFFSLFYLGEFEYEI